MKLFKTKRIKDEASILTKRTKGEKILYGVVFVIFLAYSAVLIYALLYLFINSFQDAYVYKMNRAEGGHSPFEFPEVFKFSNYRVAIEMNVQNSLAESVYLPQMFFNSLWYCGIAVGEQVLMSCFTGYVFAKYGFKGKESLYAVVIFSMTVPVVGNTGAMFKLVSDMGIYNSPLYVIVVSLSGWGFNFMVMYGFFKNVSWSYAEAVFLDGGSHFTAFFKIMLPQAKMSILTLCIVAFIQNWNNYLTPLMYLPDYPTLAAGVYQIKLSHAASNAPAYFATLIISTIPVVVIYACFSDVIMKNFSVGGLKG